MITEFTKRNDLINHIVENDAVRIVEDYWLAGYIVWTVERINGELPVIVCNTIRHDKESERQAWERITEKDNPPFYTCNPKLYQHAEVACQSWRDENERRYNIVLESKRIAKTLCVGDIVEVDGITEKVEIVSLKPIEGVYGNNNAARKINHKILKVLYRNENKQRDSQPDQPKRSAKAPKIAYKRTC